MLLKDMELHVDVLIFFTRTTQLWIVSFYEIGRNKNQLLSFSANEEATALDKKDEKEKSIEKWVAIDKILNPYF
ncbi:hypothetical protein VK91_22215 [Lysinibacillus sp. LK3]|nr:hypothetical protein VK91_22215 [Lysinibacillus sp. LK3]